MFISYTFYVKTGHNNNENYYHCAFSFHIFSLKNAEKKSPGSIKRKAPALMSKSNNDHESKRQKLSEIS